VTGAPGAGKSTLVDLLVAKARPSHRVAVVAVDPSSPFTGGAILGDRVRMQRHTEDDGVFIRSMANRGHLGGIAAATPRVVALLDGLGFDEIIIETVGVGQAEVDVAASADTVIVVVTPGWGDAVQAAKAGLIEIGDVFAVNKADRPGSDETVKELIGALELGSRRAWLPPVIETVATADVGIADLTTAVNAHRSHLVESGERERRRRNRVLAEVEFALRARLRRTTANVIPGAIIDHVLARRIDPWAAAGEVRL
jgi:LAO/AO transport system kinase